MQIGCFLSCEEFGPRERAAATSAVMTGGRFNLGVGSGEALNEHILGVRSSLTPDLLSPPMGPDLDAHAATLQEYADAGVDELFVQQIGPEQEAFFTTWAEEILPRFR